MTTDLLQKIDMWGGGGRVSFFSKILKIVLSYWSNLTIFFNRGALFFGGGGQGGNFFFYTPIFIPCSTKLGEEDYWRCRGCPANRVARPSFKKNEKCVFR